MRCTKFGSRMRWMKYSIRANGESAIKCTHRLVNSSRETGEKLAGRNSGQRRNRRLELRPDRAARKTGHRSESGDGKATPSFGRAVPQGKRRGGPAV